ncbi:MAG TPA: response regulator [Candidatus Acidoferrum sp.]|nr:response regulator [Candidatus Acidoferrum sp.]
MRERALVVDDDPGVCELIHSVLGATGIEVLALSTGLEAPTHLQKEKFAVALFDLRMESPDGAELARLARSSGLNQMTPIILMSDDFCTSAVSEAFSAGASFFLYKPIDKSRLLKLVRATRGAIEHERRRFRRVALKMPVVLTKGNQELAGETLDVSLNGLLMQAAGTMPAGSPVQVTLHLTPDAKPIVCRGCVMRVLAGNRMGVQLYALPIGESARFQEFLLPLILQEPAEATAAAN